MELFRFGSRLFNCSIPHIFCDRIRRDASVELRVVYDDTLPATLPKRLLLHELTMCIHSDTRIERAAIRLLRVHVDCASRSLSCRKSMCVGHFFWGYHKSSSKAFGPLMTSESIGPWRSIHTANIRSEEQYVPVKQENT